MKITESFDLFAGKNELERLDIMEELLVKNGFDLTIVNNKGCITYFYSKIGVENIFAFTCNKRGVSLPVIIPFEFAKRHYMSNGKFDRTIRLNSHSYENKTVTPVLDFDGKLNVKLHRVLMMESGIDIDNLEVDHISGNQGVNIPEELRACTSMQNKANKRQRRVIGNSVYEYDELHDFRDSFWIPFLHYVLGVISAEDMRTLKKMEMSRA